MKKSVLKIPIIVIVLSLGLIFILAACQKQEATGHREHRFGIQSNYVTRGKSVEGNNFYCIHMNKRESGYFDDVKAIPSVYIIDLDITGTPTKTLYSVPGGMAIEQKKLATFTLGIYNIETGELIKTIDAKGLMEQKFPNAQPRVGTNIDTLVYKGAPCLTLVVEDRPETVEQGMIDTERRLCFNLDTEEVTEMEKEREGRNFPMDRELDILVNNLSFLEANHLGENMWYDFQNLDYWAGAYHVDVAVEELPQEDVELYHMFPDLREKAEEIKAKGGEPWVDIYLTDKNTTEEILRVFIPENQKIVFDGVFITSDRSKDGKEHAVSSFEEYDKYLKPYYEDPTGVSPIFTFVK